MSERTAEIVEAVLLLNDLRKPVELIGRQLDLTPAEVGGIIKTRRLPATQKTLFTNAVDQQNEKPEPRIAPWVQALHK